MKEANMPANSPSESWREESEPEMALEQDLDIVEVEDKMAESVKGSVSPPAEVASGGSAPTMAGHPSQTSPLCRS